MINAPKAKKFVHFPIPFPSIARFQVKWVSAISMEEPPNLNVKGPKYYLFAFFRQRNHARHPASEFSLVSALKSCSSSSQAQQLHPLILRTGLDSNIFVYNSLINLYVKSGQIGTARNLFDSAPVLDSASWNTMIVGYVKLCQLDDARQLFEKMPGRDCVSFTTMIMGYAQNHAPVEALDVFRKMQIAGVPPNEVTAASLLSACAHLHAIQNGKMIHAIVIKGGLEVFLIVSTNLVHLYAICLSLCDAEFVFNEMPEKNVITWNIMLNGYTKCGLVDSARDLFNRFPIRDLVSWSTIIDGYVRVDRLSEALLMYREMQRVVVRPSEVTLVDLVSACGPFSALNEGRQFHGVILKTGLDAHVLVQATVIHFYSACQQIDLAFLQFQLCDKDNVSSWNALIVGFIRNNMIDSARQLFDEMPDRDVVSCSSMIAGYVQSGQFDPALDLFRDMQVWGLQPNEITMVSVVSAVAHLGILEKGKWIHDYICENSIPLTDNLSAGLIDMYAKCGDIENALEVFHQIRDQACSVSPWNTVICGLAMHGHASTSLSVFSDLQKTNIKPNSITFLGVLSACCHAGLVVTGKHYFERMKSEYSIDPSIKHYGCMVDLLGRAGCLEEAELLIESMPIKVDVVIWGSLLAACKTHGNVEIGERASEKLARLDPSHGAGQVLLSNIYAEAGRWDDVFLLRREMQSRRVKKLTGCSGVV